MSSAPVCQTAPGTFVTSISPPPSGVVATTSKVGSSIVSARAFAIVAATRVTPSGPQRQAVQRAILSLPPAFAPRVAEDVASRLAARNETRKISNARTRPPDDTLIARGGSFQLFESTEREFRNLRGAFRDRSPLIADPFSGAGRRSRPALCGFGQIPQSHRT